MSYQLNTQILDFPRIRNLDGPILNLGSEIDELFSGFSLQREAFHHLELKSLRNIEDTIQIYAPLKFQASTAFFTLSTVSPVFFEKLLTLSYNSLLLGHAQYIWDVEFTNEMELDDVNIDLSLPNGEVAKRTIFKKMFKVNHFSTILLPICQKIGFHVEKRVRFGRIGLFVKLLKQ